MAGGDADNGHRVNSSSRKRTRVRGEMESPSDVKKKRLNVLCDADAHAARATVGGSSSKDICHGVSRAKVPWSQKVLKQRVMINRGTLPTLTIMNPNVNRKDSGSHLNNGYAPDPGSAPSYVNQFSNKMNGMQQQQQQWSPQSPVFPPFPRLQNNVWPQQHQQSMPTMQMPNGMPNGIAVGAMQQVPPINTNTNINHNHNLGLLPANILQDVFRLSVPVGTSPNDDTLLVQVLKESVQKGQTYKQAIETLHGVSRIQLPLTSPTQFL